MSFFARRHARPQHARLTDGTRVTIRPLRDADLAHANEFFAGLSARSRYLRFMNAMPTLTPQTLAAVVEAMHSDRSAVLVAVLEHGDGCEELIGGARIVPTDRHSVCEFALSIVDAWQGHGLGNVLMKAVVRAARERGYRRIEGHVLTINRGMLAVAQHAGLNAQLRADDPTVTTVSRWLSPHVWRR